MEHTERPRAHRHQRDGHAAGRRPDLRAGERLLLALQAHAGNQAVQRIVGRESRPVVQRATGLAADVGGFVGGLAGVFQGWDAPGADAGTRRKALYTAINDQLRQLDVPKVDLLPGLTATGGSVLGTFKPDLWIMDISFDLLKEPTLDVTRRAKLADTVLHESRHAEQFFRVARLLCTREHAADLRKKKRERRDAPAIAAAVSAAIGMDVGVVTTAQQQGARLSGEEEAEADAWSQSIPFNAVAHAELEKASTAWQATCLDVRTFEGDLALAPKRPDQPQMPVAGGRFQDRFKELKKRFDVTFVQYGQAYKAYQLGLSFEADAWRTGQEAHATVAGHSPADLDTKLTALRAPWDRRFATWKSELFTAPPRPHRDLTTVRQLVQRHPVPAELEQLPEGIDPVP
ncbi:hypothetical protein [Amycolatopsis sp. CA-128772]|uniref:hypothetical protein n=1 Tax=Amycolatopsis sp. CA-128772 TaxID=2073159 RepID=UPI0018EAB491|nr:hypothetical protein [Amycolatopsis sp. CA-128772]